MVNLFKGSFLSVSFAFSEPRRLMNASKSSIRAQPAITARCGFLLFRVFATDLPVVFIYAG